MISKYWVLPLLALALIASGCDQKISSDAPAAVSNSESALLSAPAGNVVAVVNGEVISEPLLAAYASGKKLDINNPQQRTEALDELENIVLLAQEALQQKVTADPEIQASLALSRVMQLSGHMLSELQSEVDVPEQAVRAYYDEEVKRAGSEEFHLRHILFKTEAEALVAAGEAIQPNADFQTLMGKYQATGTATAQDLGWVKQSQIPQSLAESATNLTDGQVAPVPIKSEFGWHVMQRVGARPFTPPPYAQVRDGAENILKQRALRDQISALRAKASIQTPQGSNTPATPPTPVEPSGQ